MDIDKPVTKETVEALETPTNGLKPKPTFRSFFSSTVRQFLALDPNAIVGQLSSRHVAFHRAAEAKQVRAWEREIALLRTAFLELGDTAHDWSLLLEVPLLRLAKRLDAIVIAPGVVGFLSSRLGHRRMRQKTERKSSGTLNASATFTKRRRPDQ
jgi:hypothetical protein